MFAQVWLTAVAARVGTRVFQPLAVEVVQRERDLLLDADACAAVAWSEQAHPLGLYLFTQARAGRGDGEPLPGRAHLVRLAVDPDEWGRGVGRALLVHAIAAAQARGYQRLELSVRATNTRARALYELCGWVQTGDHYRHRDGSSMIVYDRSV